MNALLPTLLGAVLAPALLGAGLVRSIGLSPQHGLRLFAAWSYLVGHFAAAWATFAWVAAGKPVPGWWLPALASLLGGVLWVRAVARTGAATAAPVAGDAWVRAAVVALVVIVLERCSLTSLQAIVTSDEANIWSAKARVLYADGDLGGWLAANYAQHPDYPLLNPLTQVLAFASSGRALWWENRLPMQGFAIALLLLLSVVVERRLPRWLAIVVLVAFTSTSYVHLAATVYSDVLLAFALLALVDAWLRGQASGERVWWRLGCVALAVMLATKNEGAMLAVAAGLAALVVRAFARESLWPRAGWLWAWLAVPLVTVVAGHWFNACHGLANDLTSGGDGRGLLGRMLFRFPERAGPVMSCYFSLLRDGDATRWLVLAMLVAPLAAGRGFVRAATAWPWLLVVFALTGYMLVFVSTPADAGGVDGPARGLLWHLATAADRTVLHVVPTAVLALCACLEHRRAAAAGVAKA